MFATPLMRYAPSSTAARIVASWLSEGFPSAEEMRPSVPVEVLAPLSISTSGRTVSRPTISASAIAIDPTIASIRRRRVEWREQRLQIAQQGAQPAHETPRPNRNAPIDTTSSSPQRRSESDMLPHHLILRTIDPPTERPGHRADRVRRSLCSWIGSHAMEHTSPPSPSDSSGVTRHLEPAIRHFGTFLHRVGGGLRRRGVWIVFGLVGGLIGGLIIASVTKPPVQTMHYYKATTLMSVATTAQPISSPTNSAGRSRSPRSRCSRRRSRRRSAKSSTLPTAWSQTTSRGYPTTSRRPLRSPR